VWQLAFTMEQNLTEHEDYWDTRVRRPTYLQFWPPEKKDPKTLVEFDYPPDASSATVLNLLQQKDPRLQAIISSDAKMSEVADHFLQGDSTKIPYEDALQFLRAALDAIAPPKARETISILRPENGFQWILQPPPEAPVRTIQTAREPGAPSLANPPHLQQ
jgi:hypothetical protein